jgi:hypothetical protein
MLLPNLDNNRFAKELVSQLFIVVGGNSCFEDLHSFILKDFVHFCVFVERFWILASVWTEGWVDQENYNS